MEAAQCDDRSIAAACRELSRQHRQLPCTGHPPHIHRPFLHAASLGFTHPTTGEALQFTSPLPDDLQSALDALS